MKKQLFNTGWSFQKGVGGGMFAALMGGAAKPEAVDLPHDAMVRTPRRADAPSGGGAITLICEQAEDELRIRVLNTGKGITAEDRTRLNASLRGNNQEGAHLGLANIANRLRLIYGENMRFVVYSDAENRTVAEIDLPLTIAKEDAP